MNLEKFKFKAKPRVIRQEIEAGISEYQHLKDTNQKNSASQESAEQQEKNPDFVLKSTSDIKIETHPEEVYEWYVKAISRREREPLSLESFNYHFFEGGSHEETFAYGDKEKGYLLGFNKFNIFVPTHFAPKTLRGGYELLLNLGESQTVPAVLAITEDLGATLDKLPAWQRLEISEEIISYFRGESIKKEIYFNSQPQVKDLMMGLLLEYMNQENRGDDYEDNEYEEEEYENDK